MPDDNVNNAPAPAPAPEAPAPAPAPVPAPAPAPAPIPEYTLADESGVLDGETLVELAKHFRGAGVDQAGASQRAAEFATAVKTVNDRQGAIRKAAAEAALKADPEYGGANLEKTLASAKEAAEVLGGEELLTELDAVGLGNSPGLVKALAKLAQSGVIKGKFVTGGTATGGEKSIADVLYGG